MKRFYYISLFTVLTLLLSFKVQSQNLNEKVQKQLTTIDALNDNYTIYKQLDSLHQLKGLSPKNLIDIKLRLISVSIKLQKFEEATQLAYKGVELAEKNNADTAHATFYKLIGSINYYLAKSNEAIKYYKKSAALAKEKNILFLEVTNYQNLGGVFIDANLLDSAELYLKRAIDLSKNCGNKCTLIKITAYRLLATLYQRKKEYPKAEELYITAGKEAELSKDTTVICSFLIYHAELLFLMGQQQKALEKSSVAVTMMRQQQSRNNHSYSTALNFLSKLYKETGKYKEAYELQKEANTYIVQNYKKEGQQQLNELETKFKIKEIEKEKNIATANALAEKQKSRVAYLIFTVALLLLAFIAAFVYWNNKKKQAEQKTLAQKALLDSVVETEEKERSRIAKDLHDGIVQDLTTIKFQVKSIIEQAPPHVQAPLVKVLEDVDTASKEIREISYQMMPITLKELGLIKALQELLNRSFFKNNIVFDFNTIGFENRLSEKIETTVYRICQELINNTIKHSKGTTVSLLLQVRNNTLVLTYEDNGIGFNSSTITKGIGLNSLNSRIEMVNGSLEFDAAETAGTTAYIRIPL